MGTNLSFTPVSVPGAAALKPVKTSAVVLGEPAVWFRLVEKDTKLEFWVSIAAWDGDAIATTAAPAASSSKEYVLIMRFDFSSPKNLAGSRATCQHRELKPRRRWGTPDGSAVSGSWSAALLLRHPTDQRQPANEMSQLYCWAEGPPPSKPFTPGPKARHWDHGAHCGAPVPAWAPPAGAPGNSHQGW